jgi:serine/threonine-protein kinase
MSLAPGTRLGPYVIEAAVAAGGMGAVYRATDTRLERPVAIKVVAGHLTSDPRARERFAREARTVATLENAHICPVYDVGEQDGVSYLVMQLLDGETLAQRLRHRTLSITEALTYAIDLARALQAAHRAGVVHRDVKPGNVMVTKSGVKLLDFGLAKLGPARASAVASTVGDLPLPSLTEEGALLGTLPYMAPEQIEGKDVDVRSDIFALGAVIYEMVTGRRAFQADSQAGLIAAVLGAEPASIVTHRPGVPRSLDRVVRKCLSKDPDARWQSAGDLADELEWVRENQADSYSEIDHPWRRLMRDWRTALIVLAATAAAATAAWLLADIPRPGVPTPTRFTVTLPPGGELDRYGALAFSPDGRHLVYPVQQGQERRLFVRAMDESEPRPMAGTERAQFPFFSPDGTWLGYAGSGEVKKVQTDGGGLTVLVPTSLAAESVPGATWGPGNRIVFAPGVRTGLSEVSAMGGVPRELTTLDAQHGESSHRFPQWLPGGRAILFTAGPSADGAWSDAAIVAQALDTGERHVLIRGGSHAQYVPSGHLVYARAGTLFAVPFDAGSLRVTGTPAAVVQGVRENQSSGDSKFAVSAKGSLAYVPGKPQSFEVMWVDRRGQVSPLIPQQAFEAYQPRLSPDGRELALILARGDDDVWIYNLTGEVPTRFTAGANHHFPVWTPDGKRIAFLRGARPRALFWQPADRSGPAESILETEAGVIPESWSRDGEVLTFSERDPKDGWNIWSLSVRSGEKRPIIRTRFNELNPTISPDGGWLAYTSDETGRLEVYLQPFPNGGRQTRISRDGGTEPLWARNGHELFFREGDKLMAVEVSAGVAKGRPEALFEAPWWERFFPRTNYDVTGDGQKFVMVREVDQGPTRIEVVLNWAEELKRLVPP